MVLFPPLLILISSTSHILFFLLCSKLSDRIFISSYFPFSFTFLCFHFFSDGAKRLKWRLNVFLLLSHKFFSRRCVKMYMKLNCKNVKYFSNLLLQVENQFIYRFYCWRKKVSVRIATTRRDILEDGYAFEIFRSKMFWTKYEMSCWMLTVTSGITIWIQFFSNEFIYILFKNIIDFLTFRIFRCIDRIS